MKNPKYNPLKKSIALSDNVVQQDDFIYLRVKNAEKPDSFILYAEIEDAAVRSSITTASLRDF